MLQFFRELLYPKKAEPDLSFGLLAQVGIEPLLNSREWAQLETTTLALAGDDFTRLLDGLCLTHRYAAALKQYLAAGDSELRKLVRGVHNTFLAWESRGMLVASETSREKFDGFALYLEKAYEKLNQPFANTKLQAEAAARLVRVGMGLGETDLAKDAFELCTSLAPVHFMGHFNYMRTVSPWWHGSIAAITEFADSITDPALHRLFQVLYINEVHSFLAHEKSESAATKKLRQDYQTRIDKILAGPQQAEITTLAGIYYNNYLAGLHHILGNKSARNQLLKLLGPNLTPYPWNYFGLAWADMQKLV
ncbi:MAG: hypothetical protein EOO63_09435 [Hymenobacter sp.]|nr:MAG: hypothetical protein EOO63_09435 [Hymenobacter sp.]